MKRTTKKAKFEYDFEMLTLTDGQKQMAQMGLADVDQLNPIIRDVINKRAIDGWEPFYPFSVPALWFKRLKKTR